MLQKTSPETSKMTFYCSLNKAINKVDDALSKYKIMPGDMNAVISSQSEGSHAWHTVLGHNNSDRVDTNDNGERFLIWCLQNQMKIINSTLRCNRIDRASWIHAAHGKLILVYTDNRLLVMNISLASTRKILRK